MTVYLLEELPQDKMSQVGGKARGLAELMQVGFEIPDGIIILAEAFDENGRLLVDSELLLQQKLSYLQANGARLFAVRSSAAAEDSAVASFAGEFETVLNLEGEEAIKEGLVTVFASQHSDRVRAYSKAQGLDGGHRMNILVQMMVPAEYSGVLFTADPVSGDHRRMVGNFIAGLGEQLVSGEESGEQFEIEKINGTYTGSQLLHPKIQSKLYEWGQKLEKRFDSAQDIEWATVGKKLYLLQVRPVTTMMGHNPISYEWNDSLKGQYLWSNGNVGEAVPDLMKPAVWSGVKRYLKIALPFTSPDNSFAVGNIAGRLYMNSTVFLSGAKSLPFGTDFFVAQYENLLGQFPKPIMERVPAYRFKDYLPHFISMMKLQISSGGKKKKQAAIEFLEDFHDRYDLLLNKLNVCDERLLLVELGKEAEALTIECVSHLFNATSPAGQLDGLARNKLNKLVGLEEAGRLLSGFSNGADHLASLGLLMGLAKVVRGELAVDDYIYQYGHRGSSEVDISMPRPLLDHPEQFPEFLATHKEDALIAWEAMHRRQEEHRAARQRLKERFPWRAKRLLQQIDQVGEAYHFRERMRTEVIRVNYLARRLLLKGAEFLELPAEDIFFVTEEEFQQILLGDERAIAYIPQRKEIFQRYESLPPLPSWIYGRFDPFVWAEKEGRRQDYFIDGEDEDATERIVADEQKITGFPGAAGVVEGRVRILKDVAESGTFERGEILVAVFTNVGWTMLFPKAAAVITDVGAPLSHAAIVARELGIPAVVGCGDATVRLQTGDLVRVDGGKGIITIL